MTTKTKSFNGGNRATPKTSDSKTQQDQQQISDAIQSAAIVPIGVIEEINREHSLALNHADQAVNHAIRAGELLLQVKNSLPHGEFLSWLAKNIDVSKRQAQWYMNAGLGKPIPIRAIATPKSDTVSFLLPRGSVLARVTFSVNEILMVQESAEHPGYFYIVYISAEICFTIRPFPVEFIELAILSWLPGRHIAYSNPNWTVIPRETGH